MADTVRVRISQGELQGKKVPSKAGGEFYSFLGIPYAKPPVGPLRFKVCKTATTHFNTGGSSTHYDIHSSLMTHATGCKKITLTSLEQLKKKYILTDSSQLTADGFEKLPDQIMYPYAEPNDLQKHVFSSCQSAPKKSWGYCTY
ncbi:unnamed protein product [Timema podura]|uniref:Carboxylesterase type B domain-containing protein n=2 Tax=Timema TaxID=61471 RepID=A0ABN7P2H4_TIMPD|nr:unnamed protein product [Timema podura]